MRRSGQHHFQVQVHDLSQHGCKVQFVERLRLDETVWLKFDGLEALESNVCWVDGYVGGVEFVRPMHPAVFDGLMGRLA